MDQEKLRKLTGNREWWDLLDNLLSEEKVKVRRALQVAVRQDSAKAHELLGNLDFIDYLRALPQQIRDEEEQVKLEAQMASQAREAAAPVDDGF